MVSFHHKAPSISRLAALLLILVAVFPPPCQADAVPAATQPAEMLAIQHTACRCAAFLDKFLLQAATLFDHPFSTPEERSYARSILHITPGEAVNELCRGASPTGRPPPPAPCHGVFHVNVFAHSSKFNLTETAPVPSKVLISDLCRRGWVWVPLKVAEKSHTAPAQLLLYGVQPGHQLNQGAATSIIAPPNGDGSS
eukprot:jgi/Mesvir1/3750/Mv15025-RA.1